MSDYKQNSKRKNFFPHLKFFIPVSTACPHFLKEQGSALVGLPAPWWGLCACLSIACGSRRGIWWCPHAWWGETCPQPHSQYYSACLHPTRIPAWWHLWQILLDLFQEGLLWIWGPSWGVLEWVPASREEPTACISSQFHAWWHHVSSLQKATEGGFTPGKSVNGMYHGFFFLFSM